MLACMSDVTRLLDAAADGDPRAAELLPLVYDELRKLAAARIAEEKPGQTLQATALVHEAYLRSSETKNRGTAAAISSPRPPRRCGEYSLRTPARRLPANAAAAERIPLDDVQVAAPERPDELLDLDEALAASSRRPTGRPPNSSSCVTSRASLSARPRPHSASRRERRMRSGPMPGPGCSTG